MRRESVDKSLTHFGKYEDLPEDIRKTLIDVVMQNWPTKAIAYKMFSVHKIEFSKASIEREAWRIKKAFNLKSSDTLGFKKGRR